MRNKFGTCCMILGAALLTAALSLLCCNQNRAAAAEQASMELMVYIAERIGQPTEPTARTGDSETFRATEAGSNPEMTVVEIEGNGYIGTLSIPALELELPVMADWDDAKLKLAPCRYTGSVAGNNLVLMAHNYARHFGGLSELNQGHSVIFTDMNGSVTAYEVVAREILDPTAVEEMTAGAFDLTLFTCTYGGQRRVTVYCNRAEKMNIGNARSMTTTGWWLSFFCGVFYRMGEPAPGGYSDFNRFFHAHLPELQWAISVISGQFFLKFCLGMQDKFRSFLLPGNHSSLWKQIVYNE